VAAPAPDPQKRRHRTSLPIAQKVNVRSNGPLRSSTTPAGAPRFFLMIFAMWHGCDTAMAKRPMALVIGIPLTRACSGSPMRRTTPPWSGA